MTVLIKHILQTVRDRGNDSAFFYFESSEEKTLTCSQFRGLIFSCAAAIRSFSIAPGSRAILVGENSTRMAGSLSCRAFVRPDRGPWRQPVYVRMNLKILSASPSRP